MFHYFIAKKLFHGFFFFFALFPLKPLQLSLYIMHGCKLPAASLTGSTAGADASVDRGTEAIPHEANLSFKALASYYWQWK